MLQVEPSSAELRQPGGGGGVGGVQRALRPPPPAALQPPASLLPSQLPAPAPAPASLVSRHSLVLSILLREDTPASAGGAPAAGSPVGAAAQSGPRRQEEGGFQNIWFSKQGEGVCVGESILSVNGVLVS